jgi:hypothetical protein
MCKASEGARHGRAQRLIDRRAARPQNPCANEMVRLAVKRMSRAKSRHQIYDEPLTRISIERMLEVKTIARSLRSVAPAGPGSRLAYQRF